MAILSIELMAECRDLDAKAASDALAKSYFKAPSVFHRAKVMKVHSPSGDKEVASYVEANGKKYSIFTLVSSDECKARFIKRNRPR